MMATHWLKYAGVTWLTFTLALSGCAEESTETILTGEDTEMNREGGAETPLNTGYESNTLEGGSEASACAANQIIVLNEVVSQASNSGADWVELYNCTPNTVSLAGWELRKDDDQNAYSFPDMISVPPNGYFVIEGESSIADNHFDFGLEDDDEVRLLAPDSALVDSLDWDAGDAPEGLSYGRYPDGGSEIGTLSQATYAATNAPLATTTPGTESTEGSETTESIEGDESTEGSEEVENACGDGAVLVLNEVAADVTNDEADWIELYNCTAQVVSLDGWSLLNNDDNNSFAFPSGFSIEPNSFFVLEGQGSAAEIFFDFDMEGNDTARLFNSNGQLADALNWEEGDAPEGQSFGRYPDGGPEVGTLAETTYGSANTPFSGAASEGGDDEENEEGDDDIVIGVSIRISEVMYNPDAVNDDVGEWFEIYNAGTEMVDLRELAFSDDSENFESLESESALPLVPGQYAVLARSKDISLNGALVAVGEFSFQLGNSGDALIVQRDGIELDRFNYGEFASAKGASLQQSSDSLENGGVDAMFGDWCLATQPYGDGDLGTPGAANEVCETSAETSGGEEEGGEGIDYGAPTSLFISEFMVNPAEADDNKGEWIELTNGGFKTVNLNGLMIADNAKEAVIEGDILIEGSQSIVLGRSDDPTLNGGIDNVAYVISGINLNNGDDAVILKDIDGTELDRIDYNEDEGWFLSAGVAMQLDPEQASGPGEHNDPSLWCPAPIDYGLGDFGSPGAFNPPCDGGNSEGGSEETNSEEEGGTSSGGGTTADGKVYLNEVMAKPVSGPDWVELFNSGTETIDLSNWKLADNNGNVSVFPSGTVIDGTDYLYVEQGSGSTSENPKFDFGLGKDGAIQLRGPLDELKDVLDWNDGDSPEGFTYGRYPDGAVATGTLASPSPSAANGEFAAGVTPVEGHVCDDQCGELGIGDLPCYCDGYCFLYGDCCNATATQLSDGCQGSTCGECQPPAPCCTAGTCGSTPCANCVCETYPSCCSGVWDASCSALANSECSAACACN